MKIIMTENSAVWNTDMDFLLDHKKDVVIISYYHDVPKNHEEPFRFIDVKYDLLKDADLWEQKYIAIVF